MPGKELIVSPSEWRYVYPLIVLANYMRSKVGDPARVSRYRVTRVVNELVSLATDTRGKTATLARIMDILRRDFGFSNEDERRRIEEAVSMLINDVVWLKKREPQKVLPFIKSLRLILYGLFSGLISPPKPPSEAEEEDSHVQPGDHG